jgi:hypothetical protein
MRVTLWSREVRVLLEPAATFRALAATPSGGAWTLLRRPLLLLLFMGATVSLQASDRLSVRLIADGVISFACVPFFEVLSLAIVYWHGRQARRVPFARVVDVFFAANAPWLLWLLAFDALRCAETPLQATARPAALLWTIELSLAAVAIWSAFIDLRFFREVLPRSRDTAVRDLAVQRIISWGGILGYFVGIAAWATVIGWIGR